MFLLFLIIGWGKSQTLESEVTAIYSQADKEAVLNNYLTPLVKVIGSELSGGVFYTARAHSFPRFDLGIGYLTSKIPGTYNNPEDTLASVFNTYVADSSGISGLNIKHFSVPVAQLNFGIGDNTSLFLRYTSWDIDKIGKLIVFGAGIKYELANIFSISALPVDIGILANYQKISIDNYIDGALFEMNLISSKSLQFIPVDLVAGIGYINNIMSVESPHTGQNSFSINGLDEIRYQLGINASYSIIEVNVEFNFGQINSFSTNLRISL